MTNKNQKSEWQDIKTAPMEKGEAMLLTDGRDHMWVGGRTAQCDGKTLESFWNRYHNEVVPTHWMPKPKLPVSKPKEKL